MLDKLGKGFALLAFVTPGQEASLSPILEACHQLDPNFTPMTIPVDAAHERLVQLYGAKSGTLYLIRPDRHIAGRWTSPDLKAVLACLSLSLQEAP